MDLKFPKPETVSSETVTFKVPKIKQSLVYWLGLIPVFILALFIRIQNLPLLKGKYLIELDSYFFFRYSKMLLETGTLPAVDTMRYVPVGTNPLANGAYWFFPKTMVFFYKIAHIFFTNLSQIEWHVIYPPVITIISLVFFFLFVKEILGHRTAFIATAFLAVIPAYLQRTMAGFADHEAVAMLWMFISLWLFVLAWKSETWKKYLPFAAISGIFAGVLAATWGGYTFLVCSVAGFLLIYTFVSNKLEYKPALIFATWIATYAIGCIAFAVRYRLSSLPSLITYTIFTYIILQTLWLKFGKKTKIPHQIVPLAATGLIAIIAAYLLKIDWLGIIKNQITQGSSGRIFYTVAENAQPYFTDWWGGISWIFLLAFAGSAIYFYKLFKSENKSKLKLHWIAPIAYVIFFLAFIFGRFSTNAKYSTIVSFFSATYLYWLVGFAISLAIAYLVAYYKEPGCLQGMETKWSWMLLIVWLLLTLLMARGAIRLLFATVPPIAIAAGAAISQITDIAKSQQTKIKYAILLGLVLFSAFAFATAAQTTEIQNTYSGSMTPGQWGDAMTWIRENTPTNSVFAHWWDYGYMTVAVGERAAVTDGGNEKGWNHQSARYFLTGKDDNSTLTYLKTHGVTHILISEEEISKYPAFSLIGSDESLDRYSSIGVFGLNQTKEVRDGTLFAYNGGWQLDKDYVLGKLVLSKSNAAIGGFSFVLQNSSTITTPMAYLFSNGQQFEVPISCVYAQGKRLTFEANNSINGCLVLVPYFDQNGQGMAVGGAFWLSEKVYDTNFAKWYIYNETSPYYKLVYSDNTPLGIYQGRVIGPIKILEVEYPTNITSDPFYLQTSEYG